MGLKFHLERQVAGCHLCGGALHRIKRTRWNRLVFAAVYRCRECGGKTGVPRPYVNLLSPWTRCPHCGNASPKNLSARDGVDKMYLNPLSRIQRFLGAPLRWCGFCRLQYYDFRPRKSGE
jgi:hypothetical protein